MTPSPVTFSILSRSAVCGARRGRVTTPHGGFDTPAFMPVGTRGTVKGILPGLVWATGAQIILGNTYHLLLRPGPELIERMGGLARFSGWGGPMLTDSGGYQAYSMAGINRVDDDGVTFKSIVDGSMVTMTAESATRAQNQIGADIIMAFDDCPPSVDPEAGPVNQTRLRLAAARDAGVVAGGGADEAPPADGAGGAGGAGGTGSSRRVRLKKRYDHASRLAIANERTIRWLERCKAEHHRLGGHERRGLFGIVQGGTDLDRRAWSVERVCGVDLPGYAIGGVAVGEQFDDIRRVVEFTAPRMPTDKPRYLMGVGYERDLLAAVRAGVDMFDCVLPTRNGRNANAFTRTGQIRLRNAQFAEDARVIEPGCDCAACGGGWGGVGGAGLSEGAGARGMGDAPGGFSRAYIRHLFNAQEMLGPILVSLHNLRHFQRFMDDVRGTIASGDWAGLLERWPVARGASGAAPAA